MSVCILIYVNINTTICITAFLNYNARFKYDLNLTIFGSASSSGCNNMWLSVCLSSTNLSKALNLHQVCLRSVSGSVSSLTYFVVEMEPKILRLVFC